jgi:large subunit ribosomal protein L10
LLQDLEPICLDPKQFVVKGLGVSGDFVEASELKRIAGLPTKDQAISLVMALMLAPVEKLARSLNDIPGQVTRVVSAVAQQKQ